MVFMFMPQGIVVYVRDKVTNKAAREKAAVASIDLAMAEGSES
jgi:hypothetical protein